MINLASFKRFLLFKDDSMSTKDNSLLLKIKSFYKKHDILFFALLSFVTWITKVPQIINIFL